MAKVTLPTEEHAKLLRSGPVWACGGALVTGLVWLGTLLL